MAGDEGPAERDFLTECLLHGIPGHKHAALRPDFLVISPPKTGSTWLAANLACHPEIFVAAGKEVKYFSSFFKWLGLDWYLDHFAPAAGRVKGEASPTFAFLPVERIRVVRRLMPDVKLIFLMRAPIACAWSHAKHSHRYREATFAGQSTPFDDVSDAQWCDNFAHDWPLVSGDYLGQLRRWLSVFPREQCYLGFYEPVARSPVGLLRDVFAFLGVNSDVSLAAFPLAERIFPGPAGELPPRLERCLHDLLHDRTRGLAAFLREHFELQPPPEWETILRPAEGTGARNDLPPAFRQEMDDVYLSRVLALEETFPCIYPPVVEHYRGHDVVFHRGRFLALDQSLGPVSFFGEGEAKLTDLQARGRCFVASSLAEAKARVSQHLLDVAQAKLYALEGELRAASERAVVRAARRRIQAFLTPR